MTATRRILRPRCKGARRRVVKLNAREIAAKAKVSKHSIYRWWNSKGEVMLDAFNDYALQQAAQPSFSNDTFADLEGFAVRAYQSWRDPLYAKGLRGLIVEMSFDPGLRAKFNELYLTPRKHLVGTIVKQGVDYGQFRADLDIEAVIDVVFGFIWFHISFDASGWDERGAAQKLMTLLRPALEVRA